MSTATDNDAENARLFGDFVRLWDHYWLDVRHGPRISVSRYGSARRVPIVGFAVPLSLEDVAPFVDWINARSEISVRSWSGDLDARQWWGEWSALWVRPFGMRWLPLEHARI